MQRRKFLQLGSLGMIGTAFSSSLFARKNQEMFWNSVKKPIVLSTWDEGIHANAAAWNVLINHGNALDAVERGVMVTESEQNCCVGLNAYPDRDGWVTLDASIMDHEFNCGAVACLQGFKHPISVARKVMEKTPHVLLVGQGAYQFALSEGFTPEAPLLSDDAKKAYQEWLKKSEYKPVINIENSGNRHQKEPAAPSKLSNGNWNHDTIGMIAMDEAGNLSGSCTTSGMAFKMHGRVGDSPIIGAGLYVDNEIGAATSTGQGEDVIRTAGSYSVVEFMRNGLSPEQACRKAVERVIRAKGLEKARTIQVGYIAINKRGQFGGFSLQRGFSYAVYSPDIPNVLQKAKFSI